MELGGEAEHLKKLVARDEKNVLAKQLHVQAAVDDYFVAVEKK